MAIVQQNAGVPANTLAFGSDVSAGNTVVVLYVGAINGNTPTCDIGGDVPDEQSSLLDCGTLDIGVRVFVRRFATGQAVTCTISSGLGTPHMRIYELSGIATSSVINTIQFGEQVALSPPSISITSTATATILGFIDTYIGGGMNNTPGTGYTEAQGNDTDFDDEYALAHASGTFAVDWTANVVNASVGAVAIKEAAGVPVWDYSGSPYTLAKDTAMSNIDPDLTGGAPATSCAKTSGTLPPGVSLTTGSSNCGRLSGTPTALGTYNFGITPTNASGDGSEVAVEIEVVAAAIIYPRATELLALGQCSGSSGGGIGLTGANYTIVPTLVGTVGTITCDPALPAGLSLNGTTGAVTGAPSEAFDDDITFSGSVAGETTVRYRVTVLGAYSSPRRVSLVSASRNAGGTLVTTTFSQPSADASSADAWGTVTVTPNTLNTTIPAITPGAGWPGATTPPAGATVKPAAYFNVRPHQSIGRTALFTLGVITDIALTGDGINNVWVGVENASATYTNWTSVTAKRFNPRSKWWEWCFTIDPAAVRAATGVGVFQVRAVIVGTSGTPRLITIDLYCPADVTYSTCYLDVVNGNDGTAVANDSAHPALTYDGAINTIATAENAAGRGYNLNCTTIYVKNGDVPAGRDSGVASTLSGSVVTTNLSYMHVQAAPGHAPVTNIAGYPELSYVRWSTGEVSIETKFGLFKPGGAAPTMWYDGLTIHALSYNQSGDGDYYLSEAGFTELHRTDNLWYQVPYAEFANTSVNEVFHETVADILSDVPFVVNATAYQISKQATIAHADLLQQATGTHENQIVDCFLAYDCACQGLFTGGADMTSMVLNGVDFDNQFGASILQSSDYIFQWNAIFKWCLFRRTRWLGSGIFRTGTAITASLIENTSYPADGSDQFDEESGPLAGLTYSTVNADGPGPAAVKGDGTVVGLTYDSKSIDGSGQLVINWVPATAITTSAYIYVPFGAAIDDTLHFTPLVLEASISAAGGAQASGPIQSSAVLPVPIHSPVQAVPVQ